MGTDKNRSPNVAWERTLDSPQLSNKKYKSKASTSVNLRPMTAEPVKSSNNIKVKTMNNTSSYSIENADIEVIKIEIL